MALAGGATAAETILEVETSIMPSEVPTWVTKSDVQGLTWTEVEWETMFKNKSAAERAAALTTDFNMLGITGVGHYAFNATGADAADGKSPGYVADTGAFTITGGAALYANVQSVSDIMQGYDLTSLNSLTFTFVGSYSDSSNDVFFALYKMDENGSLTTLSDMYGNKSSLKNNVNSQGENESVWDSNSSVSYTYDVADWGLVASDNIVVLVNHNNDTTFTISDMSVTAAVNVPEPATATLSLLALAGLAARCRRK